MSFAPHEYAELVAIAEELGVRVTTAAKVLVRERMRQRQRKAA